MRRTGRVNSSWDIVKATIKLFKSFFFHKTNKNVEEEPEINA